MDILNVTITIVLFANLFSVFILWMVGSPKNIESRTDREYRLLMEEQKTN